MTTRRRILATAALAPTLAIPFGAAGRAAQDATPDASLDEVKTQWNVVFGEAGGEELLLNAFLPPARAAPHPAVILIHGGGFSAGSRSDMTGAAQELAKIGYVAFAVNYRLLNGDEDHAWPAQLDDVQRAVRWVRANAAEYNIDPERVASYGFSAGANLAMMLGVRETRDNTGVDLAAYSSRVQCVVSLGGDMDLSVPQTDYGFKLILVQFLGGTPEEQPDAYRDASPLTWVDSEAAPALIAHGGFDDTILAEQSQRMAAAMYDAGVEVVTVAIPRIDHGGIGSFALVGPLAVAFMGTHLNPSR